MRVMHEGAGADRRLQHAKYSTLLGTGLAVVTTSILCKYDALALHDQESHPPPRQNAMSNTDGNLLVVFAWYEFMLEGQYRNPFVFGNSVASICNDLGMLIASGSLVRVGAKARTYATSQMNAVSRFQKQKVVACSLKNDNAAEVAFRSSVQTE